MLVTIEVLKLERSREVSFKQPLNILSIFVAEDVSNPVTLREVSFEQLLNIEAIFVTAEVSNPVISREVRP